MEFLKSFSIAWSMAFVLIMFLMLYDLRFDRKKNILITGIVMVPIIILTAIGFLLLGEKIVSHLVFVTVTIAGFLFFFFTAKKRDGKFFFTFCFLNTVGFELITLTMLLATWIGEDGVFVLFITRLLIFPALTFVVWKYVRKPYQQIQNTIHSGWGFCALLSFLYYVLLVYMISIPTAIAERPDDIPTLLVVFTLMPLTYVAVFQILNQQMRSYWEEEQRRNIERQAELL